MSRRPTIVFFTTILAVGIALAAQNGPIQVQSETVTITESGQTFLVSATGITAEIRFISVTPSLVTGAVKRVGGGNSGTVRISWVEQGILREVRLTINDPEKLFSLEGGETDKKQGGQVGS